MTLIADVFRKLRIPKNLVRYMSKKCKIKGPLEKQHGKGAQKLLSSEQQHRYHV